MDLSAKKIFIQVPENYQGLLLVSTDLPPGVYNKIMNEGGWTIDHEVVPDNSLQEEQQELEQEIQTINIDIESETFF